jgi:hypothetical protein
MRGQCDCLRPDLHSANRASGIRGLARVASLHSPTALRTATDLNHELGCRRYYRRNVGLVLPHNPFELHLPAAGAPKQTRNLDCLIDPIRRWSPIDRAIFATGFSARLLRICLRIVSGERARLSLPCSPRFIKRLAQSRILGAQFCILRFEFDDSRQSPTELLLQLFYTRLKSTPAPPRTDCPLTPR